MSKTAHYLYLFILIIITLIATIFIFIKGLGYYSIKLEERFFHIDHLFLKSSGLWGHGFGILGSFLMIMGIIMYMARKRIHMFSRVGIIKHWLEFHIFLCTLGPILILYHTTFKFGGLVSISFWCMVAVALSGLIGRFIYIQIPKTIEGRQLSLSEVASMKQDIREVLSSSYKIDEKVYDLIEVSLEENQHLKTSNKIAQKIVRYRIDRVMIKRIKKALKMQNLSTKDYKQIIAILKNEITLNRRIGRLVLMQNLFKYWHVAHLPFALVMIIIMLIHITVTVIFGYQWIF